MIISRYFWVTQCTNLCKNYPFPWNVHHIHSDHFSSPWLHSRWWGRAPQSYVCSGTDQKWWHSVQSHLHTAGRHHRALHWVRTDTPQRCASVLSNWVSGFISFCGLNAGHGTWSYQSYGFMQGTIWLCMSLPSTSQVRAYVAVRDGHHSGTHSSSPDREELPQPSPSTPPSGWEDPTPVSDGS